MAMHQIVCRAGSVVAARPVRVLLAAVVAAMACPSGANAAADLRLLEAARNRNADAVRTLIAQRVDVNGAQGDGATALHWAAHFDDLKIADLLLHAGARASAADDTGVTPIYLACLNRSRAMVEKLLGAGANPNATLLNGETALMTCARTGEAAGVQALLARGAAVNAVEPAHDQTALMWAAAEKHPDVVAVLLAHGADVKVRSRVYMQTVTSEVTQRAGREELNYTVPRGGSTAILFAARSGDAESARLLVAAGADVNDKLANGMSALVEAAHSGHVAAAIELLKGGADPNTAEAGYTPLHAAVLRGSLDLVKVLLEHGANPNLEITKGTPVRRNSEDFELPKTLIGATPYLLAAKYLEPDIMKALAAGGADSRRPMKTGETPLMAAAGVGASAQADRRGLSVLDGGKVESEAQVFDTVTAAIALGADLDAVNQAGDTALHGAAALGYDRVIQTLVDHGAQPNPRNKRGQTPLGLIAGKKDNVRSPERSRSTQASTAELLRKLGAVE
jgi:ankyrin repeat protein